MKEMDSLETSYPLQKTFIHQIVDLQIKYNCGLLLISAKVNKPGLCRRVWRLKMIEYFCSGSTVKNGFGQWSWKALVALMTCAQGAWPVRSARRGTAPEACALASPLPFGKAPCFRQRVVMGTAKNKHCMLKLPLLDKPKTPKNYAQPEVLRHTFETLSSLHRLLPNHLMETLHSYKREEDKQNCQNSEFSGLERILARHQFPEEINATPKPSSMPLWKRKSINNANRGWKTCHLGNKNVEEPPMSTIVVRWLKKNMQPTEDLQSVIQRLSVFGPIKSVTLCGRQSAIVVFKDMTSACNAVNAFQSRTPGTMFQCSWQQRFMSKDVRLPMNQILCKFLKLVVRNLSSGLE